MKGNFFTVNKTVYESELLTSHEKNIYVCLSSYASNETGECWPSLGTISKRAGTSKATVQRAINGLIQKGCLEKITRNISGSREKDSNLYRLTGIVTGNIPIVTENIQVCSHRLQGIVTQTTELYSLNYNKFNYTEDPESFIKHWKKECHKKGNINFPEEFLSFWETYPNSTDKKKTFSLWLSSVEANNYNHTDLLTAAKNYKKSVSGTDKKYIKHSTTFLSNSEPWRDFLNTGEKQETKKEVRKCAFCGAVLHPDGFCVKCKGGLAI